MNKYFAIVNGGTTENPGWWFIGAQGQLHPTPVYMERAQLESHVADFIERNAIDPSVVQIVIACKLDYSTATTVNITEC